MSKRDLFFVLKSNLAFHHYINRLNIRLNWEFNKLITSVIPFCNIERKESFNVQIVSYCHFGSGISEKQKTHWALVQFQSPMQDNFGFFTNNKALVVEDITDLEFIRLSFDRFIVPLSK